MWIVFFCGALRVIASLFQIQTDARLLGYGAIESGLLRILACILSQEIKELEFTLFDFIVHASKRIKRKWCEDLHALSPLFALTLQC